jgi:hypothetical protein
VRALNVAYSIIVVPQLNKHPLDNALLALLHAHKKIFYTV